MKATILFIICFCVCLSAAGTMRAQAPLTGPEALKDLYRDYNPDTGKARWECTKEQKRQPLHQGWPCSPEYATVSVSIVFMAEVAEAGTEKVYLVASAVPADAPGGYDCHLCQPAIGAAVFQAQEGNWALAASNPAVGFFGGWGGPPAFDFVWVGPEKRGLLMSDGDLAQGYASSDKSLLMTVGRSVELVWSIRDEEDNAGAIDPDDKSNKQVAYRDAAAIRFVTDNSAKESELAREYFDIEVISRGNSSRDGVHLKPENWTEIYRFKDGKYRLLRHRDFVEVRQAVKKAAR